MEYGGLVTVYKETDNYKALLQEAGDHCFLHLEMERWSPSILKELKNEWPGLLDHVRGKGYNLLFTYADDIKWSKLWNSMQKCITIEKFGPDNDHYIGAWDLEE